MELTLDILWDLFDPSEESPSGLLWSKTRTRKTFVNGSSGYQRYMSISAGKIAGSKKKSPCGIYWRVQIGPIHKFYTHRILWMMLNYTIVDEFTLIDHRDGNTENNLISNLRLADSSDNIANTKTRKDNKLGIKGVYYSKQYDGFFSELQFMGKQYRFGPFDTKEKAKEIYDLNAKAFFGEFARSK